MGTGKDPRMREALRLARAGEKEQARQLLIEILKHNRDNFDAWAVMAQVTEDRKEAISSIKQALRVRPNDERAQRYLEYLLADQPGTAPIKMLKVSRWLLLGLIAAAIIGLAIAAIFFVPRLAQAGQSGAMSDAQPSTGQTTDCAALIKKALEVSDQGCYQVGRDQVCYGHDTLRAQLAPDSNARFDQPGNIIPINILKSFDASPLDLQKGDWGVGVFRLEANLPGTLPGQLVTLLVFGNMSIQNVSGDMQVFYFMSGLGGIRCDAVPFDGILVQMAEGAGFAFRANGVDITLQGDSILQAVANDHLTVTALNGRSRIRARNREQAVNAGQKVTVPLGGSNGLEANGPPDAPRDADDVVTGADCVLTGAGCPPANPQPGHTAAPGPSAGTGAPGDGEHSPKDEPTPTAQPSLTATTPATPTETPEPSRTPRPTLTPRPSITPRPPNTPPGQVNTPKPTKEPKPTDAPDPIDVPEPTDEPKPTKVPVPTPPVPTNEHKP